MPWTVQEIERDYLKGKMSALAVPENLVLTAFERVETLLGRDWILSETSGTTGLAPTMRIVGMGLSLAALEGVEQGESLLGHIRQKEQNAESELNAIHLIHRGNSSAQFELYPMVGTRVADFQVHDGGSGPRTVVEVTRPYSSQEQLRLRGILERIGHALTSSDNRFALEIVFHREPTEPEIDLVCHQLPEFCKLDGQQQAELAGDLGTILLNHIQIGDIVKRTYGMGDPPVIGLATLTGGGPGGAPRNQVSMTLPYTDGRAEEILRDEARQLPEGGPGLIMIDVGNTIGSFQNWESVFGRRFQPTLHTRVSGVCLFETGMGPAAGGYDWFVRTKLITNPHAKAKLPQWLEDAISQAGETYEAAASGQR